jgi:hypothetical protein
MTFFRPLRLFCEDLLANLSFTTIYICCQDVDNA